MAITYTARYKAATITPKVWPSMEVVDSAISNEATAVIRSALRKEQLRFHQENEGETVLVIIPWHNVSSVAWSLGDEITVTQETCFAEAGGETDDYI